MGIGGGDVERACLLGRRGAVGRNSAAHRRNTATCRSRPKSGWRIGLPRPGGGWAASADDQAGVLSGAGGRRKDGGRFGGGHVSRHRHRHVDGQDHPDGRGSAPSRRGLVGRHGGAAAASRLVRAGPGAVVGGRLRDAGRAGANASHRARGGARHRALGADVWGDAAGRVGPAGSAGDPVERHAGGRRVPRARGARAGASAHRAAPGDAGGDRAQARLGAPARTRAVPPRADRAAAEGLCAAAADRREGLRPCGQLRHAVDGRGAAGVVGAVAGRDRAAARSHAGPGRGDRADGAAAPGGGGPLGHDRPAYRRRRWRGQCLRRLRQRRHHAGIRHAVARHLGGAVRRRPARRGRAPTTRSRRCATRCRACGTRCR